MSDDIRKRLLNGAKPDEEGTWIILGEDPNCDMGGPHVQPKLGVVQGRYIDVVDYALGLSGFFTWGAGGDIERVKVTKVDSESARKRASLVAEKVRLTERLRQIEKEIS